MSGLLVGVLGGTGPAATAYFLQRLVERTEARCDQDHVRTLAFNDTAIPDRTAFLLGRSDRSPLAALIEDGQLLEACGCDLLALPCNTAHGFFDELQGALGIPVVHMVRETAAAASAVGLARIGVLATSGTVAADLYGHEAARLGVDCLYPDSATQARANRIIFDEVKAGRFVEPAALEAPSQPAARSGLRRRRARLHRAVLGFRRRDAGGRTSRGRRPGRTSRLRHHACRAAAENLEKLVTSKLAF